MLIPARFAGKCAQCGAVLARGEQINYEQKKAYCPGHGPSVTPDKPSTEAERLADELGFKPKGE